MLATSARHPYGARPAVARAALVSSKNSEAAGLGSTTPGSDGAGGAVTGGVVTGGVVTGGVVTGGAVVVGGDWHCWKNEMQTAWAGAAVAIGVTNAESPIRLTIPQRRMALSRSPIRRA